MMIDDAKLFRKLRLRVMPILVLCFVAAYVDRANLGFAAIAMNAKYGFSATVYGWAAGIFFLGYTLVEIPSNLILAKVGARRWIARIMITWGVISSLTAFVWSAESLYVARFLLGVAEAGFVPGVMVYLSRWFPDGERARTVGWFQCGEIHQGEPWAVRFQKPPPAIFRATQLKFELLLIFPNSTTVRVNSMQYGRTVV
jgi:ACS family tartrate transporter-like MFS transporter